MKKIMKNISVNIKRLDSDRLSWEDDQTTRGMIDKCRRVLIEDFYRLSKTLRRFLL